MINFYTQDIRKILTSVKGTHVGFQNNQFVIISGGRIKFATPHAIEGNEGVVFEYGEFKKALQILSGNASILPGQIMDSVGTSVSINPVEDVEITEDTAENIGVVELKDIIEGINTVKHAVANNKAMYSLLGIHFDMAENKMSVVATNTWVLAVSETTQSGLVESNFTIKPDDLRGLKLFDSGPVTISRGSDYVRFSQDGLVLNARMLDGMFPSWKNVIPGKSFNSVTLDRKEVLNTLKPLMKTKELCTLKIYGDGVTIRYEVNSEGLSKSGTFRGEYTGTPTVKAETRFVFDTANVCNDKTFTVEVNSGAMKSEFGNTTIVFAPVYEK